MKGAAVMCLLKRFLPFTLTVTIGLITGSLESILVKKDIRLNANIVEVSSLREQILSSDTLKLFNDEQVLFLEMQRVGLGSAHNEIITILTSNPFERIEIQNGSEMRYYMRANDKLKILSAPQPSYWKNESRFNDCTLCRGVILRVTFSKSKRVEDISVLNLWNCPETPVKSVIEAVKQIKFEPAKKNGHYIPQQATILYRYD